MSTTLETAATPFGNSSRRTFLKWSGVAGGTAALVSTVTDLGMPGTAAAAITLLVLHKIGRAHV